MSTTNNEKLTVGIDIFQLKTKINTITNRNQMMCKWFIACPVHFNSLEVLTDLIIMILIYYLCMLVFVSMPLLNGHG